MIAERIAALVTLLALVLVFCTGCLSTFTAVHDPETGEPAPLFGQLRAAIGKRTVAGVEMPPVVLPIGLGLGVWIVKRPPSDAALAAEEAALIESLK